MKVNFKVIGGRSTPLTLAPSTKVGQVKHQLSTELGVSSVKITLIHRGTKLDNTKTIGSYDLETATVNVLISKLPVFELKLHEYFAGVSGDPDACLNEFYFRTYTFYLNFLCYLNSFSSIG